ITFSRDHGRAARRWPVQSLSDANKEVIAVARGQIHSSFGRTPDLIRRWAAWLGSAGLVLGLFLGSGAVGVTAATPLHQPTLIQTSTSGECDEQGEDEQGEDEQGQDEQGQDGAVSVASTDTSDEQGQDEQGEDE